ncbi:MAG: glutamate racemase [Brumimicrobium sp.]
MKNKSPIGFFDSGYGGLTVLKDVQQLLPEYDYLYLGDNARAPYGTKTMEEVFHNTWECVQILFDKGCELVILACNTASAKALRRIQQTKLKDFPGKRVLGVIRPSAEIVGDYSNTNNIAVLGTEGTISSNTYLDEFNFLSPQTTVYQYACHNWVSIIESQEYHSTDGKAKIQKDLDNIISSFPNIDVILLGCTHYPILKDFIEANIPDNITVISQGEIVATALKLYLQRHIWMEEKLSKNGKSVYFTTGDATTFQEHASKIIGVDISANQIEI